MMFVLSLQSYQKGLTPQTGASPIFYFSRLACACIHVHARDEVLADNNISEYTGITDVAFDKAIKHEKQRSYYDINGRKLQSVEGKRGLFLAVDEYGSVKKIIR